MVIWSWPADATHSQNEFLIETTKGEQVARGHAPMRGFFPVALSEASRRVAFEAPGKEGTSLFWASFDFSSIGLIGRPGRNADWSPDGQKLALEKEGQIFIYDVTSNTSRFLVSGHKPTWSPNGPHVAYVAIDGSAALVNLNGTPEAWPIKAHRPVNGLSWSPDGQYIALQERFTGVQVWAGRTHGLLVCRVSNGQVVVAKDFGPHVGPYGPFRWILGYRTFGQNCRS
jgi:WD40 repeat protein